jgi:membrane protease YdiL (CAAX protease family)
MNPNEQIAVFAISATVAFSLIYFAVQEKLKSGEPSVMKHSIIHNYILRKAIGFILFGAIPALVAWLIFGISPWQAFSPNGQGLTIWLWISGASAILLVLNAVNSRNPEIYRAYPEMRQESWDLKWISLSAGGWVLYLVGYEYLFRGLLLLGCYQAFGLWPAIVINLALYAALHLPKGLKESVATLPFGALVCYLTLETGSILPAIFLHALQAVSCEFFCILRNPQMKLTY